MDYGRTVECYIENQTPKNIFIILDQKVGNELEIRMKYTAVYSMKKEAKIKNQSYSLKQQNSILDLHICSEK